MSGYGKDRIIASVMLTGSFWVLTGCSGGEVSAGNEGDYINLGNCFEASCGARALAEQSEEGGSSLLARG